MTISLLTLSEIDLAIVAALAVACCVLGWQLRRFMTRSDAADARRKVFEAKTAVPQLEAAVRSRDQRINALGLEVQAGKDRLAELATALTQKDTDLHRRDRELRMLASELQILKEGKSSSGGPVLLDEEPDEPDASADPEQIARLTALEGRYEAVMRGVIQRDDRIAELEAQLKNPEGKHSVRTLEQTVAELERQMETRQNAVAEREETIAALQTQLQDETAQRQTLEELAKRRSGNNRDMKAAIANYRAQLPQLMATIKSRDAQVGERDAKIRAVTAELGRERHARTESETALQTAEQSLVAHRQRTDALSAELAASQTRVDDLTAKLKGTREALRASEHLVDRRNATITTLEAQAADAQAAAVARQRAHEQELTALRGALGDRDFRIEGLTADVAQRDAKLELLRTTLAESKSRHEETRSELQATQTRHDDTKALYEALVARHQALQEQRDAVAAQLEAAVAGHAQDRAAHERAAAAAADGMEQRTAALAEQTARYTAMERRAAGLARQAQALAAEKQDLEHAAARQIARIQQLDRAAAEQRSHIAAYEAAAGDQATRTTALERLSDGRAAELARLSALNEQQAQRVAELEQARARQRYQAEIGEARVHALEQRLAELNVALDAAHGERQAALDELAALRAEQARMEAVAASAPAAAVAEPSASLTISRQVALPKPPRRRRITQRNPTRGAKKRKRLQRQTATLRVPVAAIAPTVESARHNGAEPPADRMTAREKRL